MDLDSFVFSNRPPYRIGRHAAFWFAWIFYYAIISSLSFAPEYGFLRSFAASFTEVALSTPLDMAFCYFIIYYLFPNLLFKGRYLLMLLCWLLASLFFMAAFEANGIYIVPYVRDWFHLPRPRGSVGMGVTWFFNLFSQINMEGCVAASIKLGKLWYVKQQELDLLKMESRRMDREEEDGRIHPAFLADLLTRLEALADIKPLVVARSIKKIRSLFTSLLYENSQSKVLLKKELSLLEEYIYLEQLTADENVQVQIFINAAPSTETIAPFILLPIVENTFRQVYLQPVQKKKVNLKVDLNHGSLTVVLNWNKPVDTSTIAPGGNVILQNVGKRLRLIYPQSHELKILIEEDNVTVQLVVDLGKAIN